MRFENAGFSLERTGSGRRLRILRMRSALIEFKGSVCWEGRRLDKASLAVILPAELARRLPENWARRLSPAGGGRKMLKCAYRNHRLTFYGASGPLLRASWTPD